ncbi:TfoX/Sxy family protein [Nocardioides sp. AX2bis]|uniref:TfoX/Sxy family protein n=1 Tax=Nocardioides sp. AX2bis TaxID=2653157 RepID=UPI0012F1303F|nr:TfoX/Sxy family protein [Nocardioides sp. AX2bis]VXC09643.1 RNA methyltransferase [Nocardioides sp. AX2bis]
MAYDVELAARVRDLLADRPGWSEKRMFGGLAFLLDGRMAVAVSGAGDGAMMVRHDPADGLLGEAHTAPMEMRGSTMTGWLLVEAAGLADDAELARWVDVGATRVRALHPDA